MLFVRAARMYQVLLVDDDPAIRLMLRFSLERSSRLHIAAEASNGVDAVSLVERLRPHAVILGVQMPFMDGITATKLMKRVAPETKIVIFTAVTCPSSVENALTAGADLFLSKTTSPFDVAEILTRVCSEELTSSWSHSA